MPKTESDSRRGIRAKVIFKPRPRNPVLVCGLPGSGYVGKLGADHLVSVFKSKKVAEYECDSFPPQVNIKEDGRVEPLKAELYHAKTGQSKDLLIFTADAQPTTSEGEYELAEAVIKLAKALGADTVYTLAAYITGSFSKSPKVYGAASSKELLGTLTGKGVVLMHEGGITGMNGLLVGMGALHGMKGVCLLGETSGYVIDAGASQAVLESLSKLLGIQIDVSKLKDKADETQKVIDQLKGMGEQTREQPLPPKREERPGYIS
ncbi:MAG: proteasome assembly chaperone family protein [Thaumarchaeota archaeon]|nr:proteasome assembly chaperone family protein [Nitrososphaerota archaeon]